MRFVIDMNLSPNWAVRLGQAGHDAVHWSAVGDDTAADADIAAWAHAEGRIVLTADRDFSVIVATSGSAGPSVVQLRCADLRVAAIGEATLAAIAEAEAISPRGPSSRSTVIGLVSGPCPSSEPDALRTMAEFMRSNPRITEANPRPAQRLGSLCPHVAALARIETRRPSCRQSARVC